MIKNILCATDGSKISIKAAKFALAMAKGMGLGVTFLTVESVTAKTAASSAFWDSDVLEAGDVVTQAAFNALAQTAEAAEVSDVKYVKVSGRDIAAAIAGYAETHNHDLIVMGSHGDTGVKALMLGSVAQHVVAKAHAPVTIVR